jgi:guanylate kinase
LSSKEKAVWTNSGSNWQIWRDLKTSLPRRSGILFLLSAPSGAGKTTLCDALRQNPDFYYTVSCTTREPRPGEIDGEDYHFISSEDFNRHVAAGDFLEHAHVHAHRYGTLREPVIQHLLRGEDLLMDIDTVGAEQIRASTDPIIQSALVDIFLYPPSLEELRRRLEKRGTESAEEIETRLRNAAKETEAWSHYRYFIQSQSIESNLRQFRAIMQAERNRTSRYLSSQ